MTTRDQFPTTTKPGRHECGQDITIVEVPNLYDVTSTSDAPEGMRPTYVKGAGWFGGVPLDKLPLNYHKYVQIGTLTYWYVGHQVVWNCPRCGAELHEDTVTPQKEQSTG